jgi:hypothetical protein
MLLSWDLVVHQQDSHKKEARVLESTYLLKRGRGDVPMRLGQPKSGQGIFTMALQARK